MFARLSTRWTSAAFSRRVTLRTFTPSNAGALRPRGRQAEKNYITTRAGVRSIWHPKVLDDPFREIVHKTSLMETSEHR